MRGDMNARTAERNDYIRLADVQDFVDVSDEGAYLSDEVSVIRSGLTTPGVTSCKRCAGPRSC